jgi:toxin ParE1/3/4
MPVIRKRPIVIEDLAEIWNYVAAENEIRADSLIGAFDRKFREIAEYPITGENRDELYRGLKSLQIGRHIVFYRNIPDGIEIVRVLHAARDIAFQFGPQV